MLVDEFLQESARRFPEKTALVCGEERVTYRELDARCRRLAAAFLGAGLRRGDRVAIYLENSASAVIAIHATLMAGGVFVVINPATREASVRHILADAEPVIVMTHLRLLPPVRDYVSTDSETRQAVVVEVESAPGDDRGHGEPTLEEFVVTSGPTDRCPSRRIDLDLAGLVYTSGSTGTPRGVMLTHLNMVAAANSITTYLENRSDDVIINVLPLSFDYGLYQVLLAFRVSAMVILESGFVFAPALLDRIVECRVTGFPLTPTIAAALVQIDLGSHDLSSLRYLTSTGAAFPRRLVSKLRGSLPDVAFYSMYGLTECKRVSYLPPEEVDRRPDSVGIAMPNTEVYVVDEDGESVPPGEVGELVVRGSNVMKGYWRRPEETRQILRSGPVGDEKVLFTGDLFRIDREGFLYFEGRRDEMMKVKGEKVSSVEIESVLHGLDGVAEAAVVGLPDEMLGHVIKAIIKVSTGHRLEVRDVLSHCSRLLERFKVPKFVEFHDELPRTSSGKIDRERLRQNWEDRLRVEAEYELKG